MSIEGVKVHPNGICESKSVGNGTRVWAFAHVLPAAVIGENCNICDNVFIENDVIVGNNVTIKCGVQVWDGIRIGDNVFIGPNATFTNDKFPRSKAYPDEFLQTVVEASASIGANATILPGITIGRSAMIGAGAVVTKSVPANAVVVGNPAVIVGYQTKEQRGSNRAVELENEQRTRLGVGECELWRLPHFSDLRGQLAPLEFDKNLPFVPLRSFIVHGVPSNKVRGEHAHLECEQFLIAVHGSVSVVVDDGKERAEVMLSDPSIGLYLSPKVWGIQYKFEPNSVLMVFASLPYDSSDYVRDYERFLEIIDEKNAD
ncbi:WxcM-like domain-containing protein (plasmid) [Phyllobacterium sp. A18/5-2]|uniref:WxcM-like domain-containing protein n=1 Tax=Phyllobacterium sp. A18/5-2 TaxID=2978392 RepID=UPI0021C5A62D|nr:WxcM-like domain-containing protein [Phyllobacterium sp. A18/5-2]UXN66763.1 WxcM-like domain-containing protein [Phyllobacterium sp. A18/5-2]